MWDKLLVGWMKLTEGFYTVPCKRMIRCNKVGNSLKLKIVILMSLSSNYIVYYYYISITKV